MLFFQLATVKCIFRYRLGKIVFGLFGAINGKGFVLKKIFFFGDDSSV